MTNENPTRIISEFRTSDLAMVSYLRYLGKLVKDVERESERRAVFVFENIDKQLVDDYNADKCCVEPKMFSAIMRQQHRAARRVTQSSE